MHPDRNFPGDPVAKMQELQMQEPGFDPWSGNEIPQATAESSHTSTKRSCMGQLRPGAAKQTNK